MKRRIKITESQLEDMISSGIELYDDNGLAYTGQEKEFPPARTRSNFTQDVNEGNTLNGGNIYGTIGMEDPETSEEDEMDEELEQLNESFPPNWNLNGCPSPNGQGPFPPNYNTYNWWHGGFQNTYDNANNQCNFLNNRFNAFMSQIDQNMSSGPPSCSPKYSNMLYNKIQIIRELSIRGNCNHSWT